MRRREDLSVPRDPGRFHVDVHYDSDAFGQLAERLARFLGTARFLVFQTGIVAVWIALNVALIRYRWDPYPFILLNLAFSTQAAYAAPLILLAQNRQADRDRAETERDRAVNARTQAEAEYIARELASVRIALADVVTTDDLRDELRELTAQLAALLPVDATAHGRFLADQELDRHNNQDYDEGGLGPDDITGPVPVVDPDA
ncbi:MAG: hypothetical protein JWL73_3550 [Actinomycetia bacterium]|nr:hypothetical protein [Actinomycetes bacterium]